MSKNPFDVYLSSGVPGRTKLSDPSSLALDSEGLNRVGMMAAVVRPPIGQRRRRN